MTRDGYQWWCRTMPSIHRTPPMRLHGRELTREVLGTLAEKHTRGTMRSNRHDCRRWLHKLAPLITVANDALLEERRRDAIMVLMELLTLDEAITLTARPPRIRDLVTFHVTSQGLMRFSTCD